MSHRLLVVDDEQLLVSSWLRALKGAGYVAIGTTSCQEALGFCDEHAFDLVIADFLMPEMDGVELLRRVRAKLPLVRSILISGKLDPQVSEEELTEIARGAVECDRFLHKPVPFPRLLAEITQLLAAESDVDWPSVAAKSLAAATIPKMKAVAAARALMRHHKATRKARKRK